MLPEGKRYPLTRGTAGRGGGEKGRRACKSKGPRRVTEGSARQGHDIGPRGVVQGGVRHVVGAEEDLITEKNGTVGWIRGVAMPFTPPMSASIAGGAIIGVLAAKKVNRKNAAGTAVNRGWVGEAAIEVDRNKIPAGAKGTLW
jgi:hypothetical protein